MSGTKRVTLKDIAAQVGVSYQTVSKVLNGKTNVAPETEAQIRRTVKTLGYRTNVTARNLRKQASHLIGYSWTPMPPDRANPILDRFLSSMSEAAEADGYHVLLFPGRQSVEQVAMYEDLIHSGRVDGFILSGTNYDDPRIRLLQEMGFPFVAFGRSNPEWSFPFVDVDGRAGVREATQHLIEQGHQQIGFIGWPDNSRAGTARMNGYFEAMDAAGLPVDPAWVVRGQGDVDVGQRLTSELLALPAAQRPTAVIAVEDHLAIGAMQAAQSHGLSVGRDFGVVGFDDIPGVQHLTPGLTSLRQPVWEIGKLVVQVLIELAQGNEPAEQQIILPPRLIVRGSSQRT